MTENQNRFDAFGEKMMRAIIQDYRTGTLKAIRRGFARCGKGRGLEVFTMRDGKTTRNGKPHNLTMSEILNMTWR